VGYARRAGIYRDDKVWSLRLGFGVGRHVALDAGFSEDSERLEMAARAGVLVRPFASSFFTDYWSPYLRGEVALVGASHLGSNYDLVLGIGHWGRFAPTRFPWLAWFIETSTVQRIGEVDTLAVRLEGGLAVTTASFWR
jgi:hypothetical protein